MWILASVRHTSQVLKNILSDSGGLKRVILVKTLQNQNSKNQKWKEKNVFFYIPYIHFKRFIFSFISPILSLNFLRSLIIIEVICMIKT